ncbi:Alpha/Beta hydrolase protein [Dactylonectria estremocensis]|uniref:1-alkyl-2-acetylglycerophosphocholine esterase n=1 Tax=Dactylonectria estremocensis TaxID=1079267 RepID=A0A9P9J6Y4_9HYPO|nr:Alpha/Beta hydrolase protein [Dactylonectria estremocensis]
MRSLAFLASIMAGVSAIALPDPSGPYPVAMRIQSMTDSSRIDPYSPANDRHKRKVMTSLFWPIEDKKSCTIKQAAYMAPITAAAYGEQAAAMGLSNETFAELTLGVCHISSGSACSTSKKTKYPLAVFSPGAGNSRLLYGAVARSLASHGYVVITVDHPYDAGVVEFPDGSVILSADISEEDQSLIDLVKVRAADVSFVVSQLQKASRRSSILKGLPGKIDFDSIVAYGHSLGGSTAAVAMLSDSRLRGGANLDGRFVDPALSKGPKQPFLMLGRPNHSEDDATWATFWKNKQGPKAELNIKGTVHGSYTDVPLILNALGIPAEVKAQLSEVVGTIDGNRMAKISTKTLSSFFAYALKSGKAKTFLKSLKQSPEITVVKSKLPGQ